MKNAPPFKPAERLYLPLLFIPTAGNDTGRIQNSLIFLDPVSWYNMMMWFGAKAFILYVIIDSFPALPRQ